jgi:PmbA protein
VKAPEGAGVFFTHTIDTLRGLLEGKADSYELFFSKDDGISVEAKGGAVDALKVRSNAGVGLRVISGGRQGFGFSSVLEESALREMVSNTLDGSTAAAKDAFLGFPPPGPFSVEELGIYDETFTDTTEEEMIGRALKIEQSAKAVDPRIARVRKASYQESITSVKMINSDGLDVEESATFFSGSVTAVAEAKGEAEMGWEVGLAHTRSLIDPDGIGAGAARSALRMLGARSLDTVKCPAVMENRVVTELLGALSSSFMADTVHKGKSMLIGKIGKKIVAPTLKIVDDGLLPGGWSTALFDGEGVGSTRTQLVGDGVCERYLYDSYWAKRDSVTSTGNASRSRYKSMPTVGVTNLYIEEGSLGLDELIATVSDGLFITELLGVHMINSVSGDFSVGASGFWIEGGKLAYPVRGMAISGNLLELFKKVESCGADLRFIGSIGAPSILVSEVEASGS